MESDWNAAIPLSLSLFSPVNLRCDRGPWSRDEKSHNRPPPSGRNYGHDQIRRPITRLERRTFFLPREIDVENAKDIRESRQGNYMDIVSFNYRIFKERETVKVLFLLFQFVS